MELDYENEAIARLLAALTWSQKALEEVPPDPDLHSGTALANAWALITIAYSGIEQSLKYMLARRSALPVDDWILTPAGKKHKKHHLLKLFDDLDACDQYALNEYYARFQSLHNYIEEPTLRSFLCKVSDQGKGYERWRYALVNATAPNDLPRNSADAMLAIWSASVYLIQHRQNATGFMMPDAELWEMLDDGCLPIQSCAGAWSKETIRSTLAPSCCGKSTGKSLIPRNCSLRCVNG